MTAVGLPEVAQVHVCQARMRSNLFFRLKSYCPPITIDKHLIVREIRYGGRMRSSSFSICVARGSFLRQALSESVRDGEVGVN